jgi:hypothetical protein
LKTKDLTAHFWTLKKNVFDLYYAFSRLSFLNQKGEKLALL